MELWHGGGCLVTQSCPTLCDTMDCSSPDSSVVGFTCQEYWSGLPFPSPGDLPNPGTEPMSPALAGGQEDYCDPLVISCELHFFMFLEY